MVFTFRSPFGRNEGRGALVFFLLFPSVHTRSHFFFCRAPKKGRKRRKLRCRAVIFPFSSSFTHLKKHIFREIFLFFLLFLSCLRENHFKCSLKKHRQEQNMKISFVYVAEVFALAVYSPSMYVPLYGVTYSLSVALLCQ